MFSPELEPGTNVRISRWMEYSRNSDVYSDQNKKKYVLGPEQS